MKIVLIVNDHPHICDTRIDVVAKIKEQMSIEFMTENEIMESMFQLWVEGYLDNDMGLNAIRLEFWDSWNERPIEFETGRNDWMLMIAEEAKNCQDSALFEELQSIVDVIRLTRR
jgi:hypothetical protein